MNMKKSVFATCVAVGLMAGVTIGANAKEAAAGSLSFVQGNVTVGGNGFVAKAASGTELVNGSVVTVSSNGRATVKLNQGCNIILSGGQHLTVDAKASCDQLQASVQQLFSPYQVAQGSGTLAVGGGGAGGGAGLGVVGAMAGASVVGFAAVKNDEKTSGS